MSDLLIRPTIEDDVDRILEIYAPFVMESWVSFEEVVPDTETMWNRITTLQQRYPWLTATVDGRLAGYAYGGPHRVRMAYRWSSEVSVYVDDQRRNLGIGRALYSALFAILRLQNVHVALAGIVTPNDGSLAFHRSLGFEIVGTYRKIGYKHGAWRDVTWLQKHLGAPAGSPGPFIPRRQLSPSVVQRICTMAVEGIKKG